MAQAKKISRAKPLARGTETGAPAERAAIPDPLGDAEHVVPSGRLNSQSRDHEGLLGSGKTPLSDGGVGEHPTHDHGAGDDMQPDDYEGQFADAPATGFEPREDDGAGNDNEPAGEDDEASRADAGAGDVTVRRRGSPD